MTGADSFIAACKAQFAAALKAGCVSADRLVAALTYDYDLVEEMLAAGTITAAEIRACAAATGADPAIVGEFLREHETAAK